MGRVISRMPGASHEKYFPGRIAELGPDGETTRPSLLPGQLEGMTNE